MLPVKRFSDFIEQNNLFGHNSKVLAAVSGGMDSVVMAHLLKSAGFSFGIAHCNFQLRGDESLSDQEFCNNLAERFRVPFHTTVFDTSKYAADEKNIHSNGGPQSFVINGLSRYCINLGILLLRWHTIKTMQLKQYC